MLFKLILNILKNYDNSTLNNYPLSSDKMEIKREMLSDYQLKITHLDNIPIAIVKILVPNFFDKKMWFIMKLETLLDARIKTKKNALRIIIQSISMAKTMCWIKHTKTTRSRKKWWKRWKSTVLINEQCCIWKNNGKLRK